MKGMLLGLIDGFCRAEKGRIQPSEGLARARETASRARRLAATRLAQQMRAPASWRCTARTPRHNRERPIARRTKGIDHYLAK
jgi:hypothetical protein